MDDTQNVFKLTETELEDIKNIQQKYNSITFSYGQNLLEQKRLSEALKENESARSLLDNSFTELKVEEKQIMNGLSTKYGVGNIDLAKGEITVIPQPSDGVINPDVEEVTPKKKK